MFFLKKLFLVDGDINADSDWESSAVETGKLSVGIWLQLDITAKTFIFYSTDTKKEIL